MVLDFLNSHIGIQTDILTIEENSILVEAALNLITRKDFACLKKFSNWLLSHLEDEELPPDFNFEDDKAIAAIVPALISIFNERPKDAKSAILAITIIQTLLYENALIIDTVMDKVTVDVLDYIQDYMEGDYGSGLGNEFIEKFKDSTHNFFEHIGTQISSVLKALGRDLSEKMDTAEISKAVQSLKRIEFSFSVLNLEQVEDVNDLLRPILSRILAGVQKLSKGMSEPKNTIEALNLAKIILHHLKEDTFHPADETQDDLADNVEKFNKFFSDLCSCIINDYEDSALCEVDESNRTPAPPSAPLLQTLKPACNILYEIQKYASADTMDSNSEWLDKLLKCCKSDHISVSIISIENILKVHLKKSSI